MAAPTLVDESANVMARDHSEGVAIFLKPIIHCAVQQAREDMQQFLTAYLLQRDGVVCRVPAEPAARRVRVAPEARLRGRQRLPALVYRFQAWRSLTAFFLTLPFYIIICLTRPFDMLHAELTSQAQAAMVEAGYLNETTPQDWGVLHRSGWMFLEARRYSSQECSVQWFKVDLRQRKACLDTGGILGSERYLFGQRAERFFNYLLDLGVPFRVEHNGRWLSLPAFLASPPEDAAHVRIYPLRGGAPKRDVKGQKASTLRAGWPRYTEDALRSHSMAELRALASCHGVPKAPKEELVRGLLRAQTNQLNSASSSARGSAEVSVGSASREDNNKKRRDAVALRREELNKKRREAVALRKEELNKKRHEVYAIG